jgi:hypothetical protein
MSKPTIPQSWFTGWRSAPETDFDDLADLGTAFGLDMSLRESSHDAPPVRPEPSAGWAQRLGLGRKPGN